jgi:glycerophosphoryl diester phosphodiesterase
MTAQRVAADAVRPGPRSPVLGSRPLVIGHRGFAARFPDNSLAGVRAAIEAGADGVEVDVRPCAGGVWVCHHDRTRARRPIAEWPLAALSRAGVPTLAQVIGALPAGRWLFVEVKPLAAAVLAAHLDELVALLAPRVDRTRVISSSLPVLAAIEAALPAVARSWVFGELPPWLPNGVDLSPKHTLVETLLPYGRPLHPWTVNAERRMRRLAGLGVASLTSNRPDLAVAVLNG